MIKKLLIFLIVLITILFYLKPRTVLAFFEPPAPTGLTANATCEPRKHPEEPNPVSVITFTWKVDQAASNDPQHFYYNIIVPDYFSEKQKVNLIDWPTGYTLRNVPANKTYSWSLEYCNNGGLFGGCSTTTGSDVTSLTCSGDTAPPPETSPNHDCQKRSNACANTTNYPDCQDFTLADAFDCQTPPNCSMHNYSKNTVSCAYAPGHKPLAGEDCTGPGTCATGLVCIAGRCETVSIVPGGSDPYAPITGVPCDKLTSSNCDLISSGLGFGLPTDPGKFISVMFGIVLSLSGGIATLLIIISGYRIMASQGNAEKLQAAREQLTAAIVGLLFIIFSLVFLQTIGYDILHIPGFGK